LPGKHAPSLNAVDVRTCAAFHKVIFKNPLRSSRKAPSSLRLIDEQKASLCTGCRCVFLSATRSCGELCQLVANSRHGHTSQFTHAYVRTIERHFCRSQSSWKIKTHFQAFLYVGRRWRPARSRWPRNTSLRIQSDTRYTRERRGLERSASRDENFTAKFARSFPRRGEKQFSQGTHAGSAMSKARQRLEDRSTRLIERQVGNYVQLTAVGKIEREFANIVGGVGPSTCFMRYAACVRSLESGSACSRGRGREEEVDQAPNSVVFVFYARSPVGLSRRTERSRWELERCRNRLLSALASASNSLIDR